MISLGTNEFGKRDCFMKRKITKMILLAVLSAFVWFFAAGSDAMTAQAACSHEYEWQTTQEPTCTTGGYEKLICIHCGNVKDGHSIPFLRHNYKDTVTKQPTCTEEGVRTYTCTRCKDHYTEPIAKTAHDYEWKVTVSSTCCSGGREEYICKNCGKKNGGHDTPFDESKHNWVLKKTTKATCTKAGSKYYECSNAGCSRTKTEKNGDKLGHHMVSVTVTEPTCCTGGLSLYKCDRKGCSCVEQETKIPATGKHHWEETARKNPTCGKDGYIKYTCSTGGGTKKKVLEKTGKHKPAADPVITEPTCVSEGKKEWFCTVCGLACQGESIAPTGKHKYEKVDNLSKASTCQTHGYDYMKCVNEGCTKHKKVELPLADHKYKGKHYVMKEATCTEEGYSYQYCSTAGCSACKKVDIVKPLGHDLSESTPQALANGTSYDAKYHTLYCTRCKKNIKKKHNFQLVHITDDKTFYDKDVYVCMDEDGHTCGCCKMATDCVFDESKTEYYDIYRNLNDGTVDYLVRIEKECTVCHTRHSITYRPCGGKANLTLAAEIAGIWKHWIDTGLKKTIIKVTGIEVLANGSLMIKDAHLIYKAIVQYMEEHPEAGTSIIRNGDTGAIGQIEKELGNIRNQKDFRNFVEYNYDNAPTTVNRCTVTKVNYDSWHIVE